MLTDGDFINIAVNGETVRDKAFFITEDITIDIYKADIRYCVFFFAKKDINVHLTNLAEGAQLIKCVLVNLPLTEKDKVVNYAAGKENISVKELDLLLSFAIKDMVTDNPIFKYFKKLYKGLLSGDRESDNSTILDGDDFIELAINGDMVENKIFIIEKDIIIDFYIGRARNCLFLTKHCSIDIRDSSISTVLTNSELIDLCTKDTKYVTQALLRIGVPTVYQKYIIALSKKCLFSHKNKVVNPTKI